MQFRSLPNGMDDKPTSHRQPKLSSTSQASPASRQLPRVQKASSQMSQTPRPLVGMNSMYRVKDTGTPPSPSPTQKRKKISHCNCENESEYQLRCLASFTSTEFSIISKSLITLSTLCDLHNPCQAKGKNHQVTVSDKLCCDSLDANSQDDLAGHNCLILHNCPSQGSLKAA